MGLGSFPNIEAEAVLLIAWHSTGHATHWIDYHASLLSEDALLPEKARAQ